MFPLAQMPAPQLPPLPEGPLLESVRGPIEASGLPPWAIATAAITVILLGAGLIWLCLRNKQKPEAIMTADEIALAEIDAAAKTADDERFAVTITKAVRRFLASRFSLPATSSTSSELLEKLTLPSENKAVILKLLNTCDSVKFARKPLDQAQRIELLDTARSIIQNNSKGDSPV